MVFARHEAASIAAGPRQDLTPRLVMDLAS